MPSRSASGTLLIGELMRAAVRAFLAILATAVLAAAVQPLERVAPNVLFLPDYGVALNARNGHVLWRFPRFHGEVRTDGRGLLLVSWVSVVNSTNHLRVSRICRVDAETGRQLWCRDWARLQQWTLDTLGGVFYVRTPGRLQVAGVGHGNVDRTFHLPFYADLSLMPLPQGGALLLERKHGRAVAALTYRPGVLALDSEPLPPTAYPFRGDGRGLLFYARQKGEFFLAAPLRLLFRRPPARAAVPAAPAAIPGAESFAPGGLALAPPPAAVSHFPHASLDDHAFLFTDWQGNRPILRGGTYAGALWQAPRRGAHPQLALTAGTAVMLDSESGGARLSAYDLATGAPAFRRSLPRGAQAMSSDRRGIVLQSGAAIRLYDGATGRLLWSAPNHAGPLAAMTPAAIVFWEGGGQLIGLARANGQLLWRVRFKQRWSRHWF